MRKIMVCILCEGMALVAVSNSVFFWAAFIFFIMGFNLNESVGLFMLAPILPIIFLFLDKLIYGISSGKKLNNYYISAGVGTLFASYWVVEYFGLVAEHAFIQGNINDVILSGIIIGVPSGVIAMFTRNYTYYLCGYR